MTDRSKAPSFNVPKRLVFPKPEEYELRNGLKLTAVNSGTSDIVRLSLVFNAGSRYQNQTFVASATLNMLSEGTRKYDAAKIAELLDFYGSALEVNIDRDFACISSYSLNKYLKETLEVLEQLVKYPTFPEEELKVYTQKHKERLIFERERIDKQAVELMVAALYGAMHPYGSFGKPEDYDSLTAKQLSEFHHSYYSPTNAFAVVSGKLSSNTISLVEDFLGSDSWGSPVIPADTKDFTIHHSIEKQLLKEMSDSVQSAIRIGKIMFSRTHPDYNGMTILNTIFGGYFGSRLMKNIREEKGYAYGIYSMLVGMKESGYFTIATETGIDYTTDCINEIRKELDILQNIPIKEEELALVKNYIIGDLLRSLDGPIALADVLIDLKQSKLEYTQVNDFFNEVVAITPNRLQELANTYLNTDTFTEVVVGNK
ncbi:MAG: insulinase family protein [Prevotellaceae bacterium]|jgi:predicted Zn-dependent peptidase|nr:insulinase family protein [Prevotellaceae bacterium]